MGQVPYALSRVGLAWLVTWPAEGVELRFDAVREGRDGLVAEVGVSAALGAGPTGHVRWSKESLLSMRSRDAFVRSLTSRLPAVDWATIVEHSYLAVVGATRAGEPEVATHADDEVAEQSYIVRPLLPRSVASVLFGPGGSSKSYLALAIGLSLTAGRSMVPELVITDPCAVLYLDWETDRDTFTRRLRRLVDGAGWPRGPGPYYRRCSTPLHDDVGPVAEIIARRGVGLLIVDSVEMASGAGGEWSDANERAIRLHAALRLLGTTSLLVDHIAKSDLDASRRNPYGSIFKTNLARSVWELRKDEDMSADATVYAALRPIKINDGPIRAPIGLRIIHDSDSTVIRSADLEAMSAAEGSAPRRIVTLLARRGMLDRDAIAEAMPDVRRNSLRVALHRLERAGEIIELDGRYGAVTRDEEQIH